MLDINSLSLADPNRIYLTSYYISGKLVDFDKSQKNLRNFLVVGGPPPIKSSKVEIGVRVYKLPEEIYDLNEITETGGYLAMGIELSQPIQRFK